MENLEVKEIAHTPNDCAYAIETHLLSKEYSGVKVVNELDLKIPQNSIIGFLGPNGAGKNNHDKATTRLD